MADEFYGDAGFGEEFFFERKDAEGLDETATDYSHSPGPPSPELWADVVDVADVMSFQLAGETEMKAGEVGEDGEGGLAARGFVDKMAHGADEARKMTEDFGDAYDGDFGIVGDDFDAGGAHLRAAHAEGGDVGALFEGGGEARGVHVSAGFTGGEKEGDGWHAAGRRSVRCGERRCGALRMLLALGIAGQGEFLLLVLKLIEAIVDAAWGEEFLVRALFAKAALVEDEDAVGVLNGAESVRDHESGAAAEEAVEGVANLQLGLRVHAGGGFVEDEEAWIVR